ncbi:ABC transporter permease [Radiobacillus sp. PE A8.2]|uniref:ABC transporter permease n=1 Tax=Radiobacillus sp. PE A8.2 TaxID=3380349 RepID=UPI00388EF381
MINQLRKLVMGSAITSSILSLILAFLFSGLVLLLAGYSPVAAYGAIAQGAFGDLDALANTLAKATPIMFTGLAVAIAFRGGLFNIGAEGQLYLGAFTAAIVGIYLNGLPGVIHIVVVMIAAGLVGSAWSFLAGFIKVKWRAHEVIVTIMLNYIAILLTEYLVNYVFKAEGMVPRTEMVAKSVYLPQLVPHSQLTIGIFFAIAACLFMYWFFRYHVYGYEIRAIGLNPTAAKTGGINHGKRIMLTMAISGFVAALAGAVEVIGVHHYFINGLSPGYGFDGIAVAVLGRNNPIGVIFSAILFGALRAGGMRLDRSTEIPADFVIIIQALVIIFVATPWVIKVIKSKKKGGEKIG